MITRKFEKGEAYIFDLEGDGLHPTKIYCVSAIDVKGEKVFSTTDYNEMRKFFLSAEYLIGHNIISFDIPVIERLLNIKVTARLIDTLAISWYLYPTRSGHGLAFWGEDLGIAKPEINDWHNLSVSEYIHRCEEDCKINLKLFKKMWVDLFDLYNSFSGMGKLFAYLEFKMHCVALQEKNRWKVDTGWANEVLGQYEKERESKIVALAASMPKVPKYAIRKRPAKFYKKNDEYTAQALKWIQLCQKQGLDPVDGPDTIKVIIDWDEPNPGSSEQVKDWLFSLGWKPTEYKHVKDSDGNMKEIPQINLPFGQGICPDIERLIEDGHTSLEALEGLSVLNHRIPQIKTLLKDVDELGYAYAGVSGFANTLRMRHARLVNMPKPERKYSEGIRASLVADEGTVLLGSDLSSLEDRIKQHFIFPLDPDYVKTMQTDDFDPHLTLAKMGGAVTDEDIENYKNKNDPGGVIKSIRSIYKNGNYACQYGAGVPRLVITTGATEEVARQIHEAYWNLNWSVKEVASQQRVEKKNTGLWLYNPVSGLFYSLRNKKDIFSTLVQGTAAFIFDYWLGMVIANGYSKSLVGQFHDEFILRIPDNETDRQKAEELVRKSIAHVEKVLKFNVTLGCDVQFGYKYSDIH